LLGLTEELRGRQKAVLAGELKSETKGMELRQKREVVNALRAVKVVIRCDFGLLDGTRSNATGNRCGCW
jgi:hypothetical protein